MVHMPRHIKLLPLIILFALPARAAEPAIPLDFSGHYDFAMGGITFGKLDINLSQKEASYNASADVATVGLAKVFVEHKSHTTSNGKGSAYQYNDVTYESRYQTRKKPKYVKWVRVNGQTSEQVVEPPDNRESRPAVDTEAKDSAVDPLQLAAAIRMKLAQAINGNRDFSVDYYDGRRLARLHFKLIGTKTIRLGENNEYEVYQVTGKREPLAGFTKKELSSMKNDPSATLYFTQDKLIPIRLELPMLFGIASATLAM